MNKKKKSSKKVVGIAMAIVVFVSILAIVMSASGRDVPVPPGSNGTYYLDPDNSSAPAFCQNATVDVWINSTIPLFGGTFEITTNPDCGNIVIGSFDDNTTVFNQGHAILKDTGSVLKVRYQTSGFAEKQPGVYHLGNFSMHCNSTDCCVTDLNFTPELPATYITNTSGNFDTVEDNGTFKCLMPPPNITSFAPPSPVSDYVGALRTFNITINQTVNVSWLINGSVVKNSEKNVTEASYTNTSAKVGIWNVSAIVENANGTDQQTWIWNVMEPEVLVNEFVSNNGTTEWIELYNKKSSAISLTGWTIENNQYPQSLSGRTIPADGYLVLTKGTNFTFILADPGDTIILKNGSKEVDKVAYGNYDDGNTADNADAPGAGKSAGRHPNGMDTGNDSADFRVFDFPTPGAPNTIAPTITGFSPTDTHITNDEGTTREFNITVDQTVDVEWKINGTVVKNTEKDVTEANYTNSSAVAGYWEVTATASNTNGSATQTWWWTVNDTTAPTVINWAPTGTNMPVTTNITAIFSEAMNSSTLNTGTVLVENSTGAVTGVVTYDSATRKVTFDPASNLEYNETYNVTITTGVEDLAGNNMDSNYTWNFTTSAPPSTTVAIADVKAGHGESIIVPIMVNYVTNLGSATIDVSYNASIVHVTDVTDGTGNALKVQDWNPDNITGIVRIVAWDTNPHSGNVTFANVTYKAVGSETGVSPLNITVRDLEDYYNYTQIEHILSNGSFTIKDVTEPMYTWIDKNETGTTGETTFVNISATDNIEVTVYNITINGVDYEMTKNGDYYTYDIPIPWDSIDPIYYNCTFKDGEGNSNTTETVTITVTDNDEPTYAWIDKNETGTTGETTFVNISATDNIEVTVYNITINGVDYEMTKNGDYYTYNISIPSNSTASILYNCTFKDGEGNSNTTETVTITVTDNDKPTLTPALSRPIILNDNGRARPPGTNYSVLNVTAIDNIPNGISAVTVNLSSLNLSGAQSLTRIGTTDVWTVTLKAPYEDGVNSTNTLGINVTDQAGNFNTSTVDLTVIRRGDVVRNNMITSGDAAYIAKYLVGKEPMPDLLVADIAPAEGNGRLTSGDALYIAKHLVYKEPAP